MKTIFKLSDELFRRSKAEAALRGRRFKDLVEEGLRLILQMPRGKRTAPSLETLMQPSRGIVDSGVSDLAWDRRHLKGFGGERRRDR